MMAPFEPEPWDYEAFVRHYNELARESGGYDFDRASMPEEKLRHYYESASIRESPRDFARTRFQLDQQI